MSVILALTLLWLDIYYLKWLWVTDTRMLYEINVWKLTKSLINKPYELLSRLKPGTPLFYPPHMVILAVGWSLGWKFVSARQIFGSEISNKHFILIIWFTSRSNEKTFVQCYSRLYYYFTQHRASYLYYKKQCCNYWLKA